MADKIKVGLLTHAGGAHVIGYLHALAASEDCAAVVLADPDGRWEKDARRILGPKLTSVLRDYDGLLTRERPEMVLVTMEALLAPPVIKAALENDCHVFAEKPSCVRAEDFAPLVQMADSRHRYLMLALANRLNPAAATARELISSGRIGKVFGLEMHLVADQKRLTRSSYHETWYAKKGRAGGGHLIWLGIHWLDLAMFMTDSAIETVTGLTANVGGQPIEVEDSAATAFRFENGSLGTMTSGYYLDTGYHSHIKIWGSDGWLHLESMKDAPLHWSTTKGDKAGEVIEWSGPKNPRSYTPIVREAVRACAQMTPPPISSADSLRALSTVFSIYKAAETGRTVKVPS